MPKQLSFEFTVKLKAPEGTTRRSVKALLKRLIACGQQEAADAPDDYDDPDVELARAVQIKVTDSR